MIKRNVADILHKELRKYPAVALLGPRQCGKTTLAKTFPGRFFDLENEGDILKLDLAWDELIVGRELIILDEAQVYPSVFSRIRSAIDDDRKRQGRFLLLGSVSPVLLREVSESLAGRLSLVELAPLNINEVGVLKLDQLWLCGGYPDGGILGDEVMPGWQMNYLTLLAQRDLPAWGLPAKPQVTIRLFKMLAALHGTIWNASAVGQSLGLNYQTVNSYLDYLEGAYLIRRLPPFYANIRKRLVKSPKIYWRDSGLQHALMKVSDEDSLLSLPWVGASWEGFIIEQILSHLHASGIHFDAWHCRTSDQHEIDLVLEIGQVRWAVEIKLTTQPTSRDMQRLVKIADMIQADKQVMVSRTNQPIENEKCNSVNLPVLLHMFEQ